MNIFIYPDIFSQFDNGSIAANVDLIEDYELITSSFNSSTDPYENFGLISVTSTPATEQITLDSNPPSVLNYRTGNVDTSEDYGSLRYGLKDPFSIESYGLIISSVDEFESYDLISTPIYSYGTTSKTITYGLDSILYLESPENFGLITENPYIQYGFLTDSVTYTDYGSVADSLPANQYTDYGNNNLLASDEDYGLVQDPYNEYTDYHFIFYSETVYPYGTFGISGSGAESFTPQTATGSGLISASGIKGEAITDFYGIDTVAIDTSLEDSIDHGSVASAATETEDYGLVIDAVTEVDSYGFLYPVITPYGLFNISGTALDKFESRFVGSGSIVKSGILEEKNTDRYSIDSILPGASPENYGTVNTSATESESYGLVTARIDQSEDYHYVFYTAGETVYPYGTIQISGSSSNRIEAQFTQIGSGSISASGVGGEAITDFYGVDSSAIDTSIESSINYGLVSASADETEDYGLIIASANEVDSYGFLQTLLTSFGAFNITGTAGEAFTPQTYIASGSISESGFVEQKNTDRYSIDSILPGGSPEDYGTVNTSATESESYGLVTVRIDQSEDYHYIFYPAGETITPYGTFRISGASFDDLRIKFIYDGSGSISASGVGGEAITDFYGVDSSAIDTSIESSINYGLITSTVDETEDYGIINASANEVDSYGFLQTLLTSFGAFNITGTAGEAFAPQTYIASGSIVESGIVEEKNTDRYSIDSILPGGSPEDYGTVNTSATTSDNFGLVTTRIAQSEDYHYIFYPAGETIYPYGTATFSGASFDELKIKFTCIGSGSISASGVKGEAITDSYNIDSSAIDTSIEPSINYGLIDASVDETEDYGLIIDAVTEVDSYGFLQTLLTSFGAFNIKGTAGESFIPTTYIGSGSFEKSGVLEEKNTDRYSIDSILPGGSPEDYGSVGSGSTTSESYGLITAPVDQVEDYHYIFYPAGETITPYGTFRISGASFDDLRIKFIYDGSGSISASGVKGEAITKFYGIDSDSIDADIEFSTSYGLISDPVDETEDYELITSAVTEVDSYGFLYPRIIPFGLFDISGSAGESFIPTTYIGSGSFEKSGVLEEKNTDRYTIDSILPGSSPENYGSVGSAATTSESYGLVTAPIDQVEDYHYIFYPSGETITPYGTIQISGASFDELKIQFVFDGSGSISASGIKTEAITKFYGIDSDSIDTSIEFSTSYGLVSDSIDETEDYGLITSAVTDVDSYGFLYPRIVPFGLFDISGSAGESFIPTTYIGSGSFEKSGILEEKNTDRYTIDSILPGGSPEDYGTVGSGSTSSESYGLITAPVDQVEDYHYIFYPAGETITPYGTIQISGASFDELKIQFVFDGSGFIFASGVKGEAITDFYNIDSVAIDTSLEDSIDHGSVTSAATETDDYELIISTANEVDSYGFLYPIITPFGLFDISGSARESFKPASYIGSGSLEKSGILEEKNTDRYTIDSILPGDSPEDYGSVGVASTTSESYGLITAPVDQVEDYHYIFYPAGETITPYGTIQISGASFDELKIQFVFDGSGSISASGVKGEAITKFYGIDSDSIDADIEFSTSYGLVSDSIDETEDYGLITSSVDEVDSYGFLYPRIIPFGLFDISGSARESFKPASYIGSGSLEKSGILEEKNTDSYNLGSILPGGSPEDYGSVGSGSTSSESYGLITAPVDQVEDYHYIFYPAGETITPFGTIRVSGDAITELGIQFVHEGSGSISASGVGGEAITDFYNIDSIQIDTSLESSIDHGSVASAATETEDYGLITSTITDVDIYGFLYPIISPFGLFDISGSASERFNPSFIGSGSLTHDGILEEKNTDSYNLGSILPGGSPEDYGSVGVAATTSESYGLVTASIDQAEDYYYIFYTAGETVYPYGTIRVSGDAITELGIQFVHEGSGFIAANGIAGEAITKFYSIDSIQIDTSLEDSIDHGSVASAATETEDYGLITSTANEVDSYGFLYPVITPFGLFDISGSARESFKPAFVGSGSIDNAGILEEKNTDSYNLGSILPGGSPEDYGTVNTSATFSEDYEFIISPLDQAEDYHYIFYTAGETVYPYGTIQISGDAITELGIQFVHEGSGSIAADGVAGEAITKFYGVDSDSIDTNIEFSTSYGLVSDPVDETEDYGLITSTVTDVDSYGFLYSRIVPFGLFDISGSAGERFNPSSYVGSGSLEKSGILEEKNTDSYNLGSILPGGSPEDYGTVNTSATTSESYGLVTASVDQVEDYHYIFYTAGETVYPYGTIQISGDAITELGIQFVHEGSGSISASGVAGEAITKFYGVDSDSIDTNIEFSTSYGLVSDPVDETEDYGLITSTITEVDSYGFLYPRIVPFGLFDISGSAGERFNPSSYVGSGSIIESGVLEEKNTDSYNLESILLGSSPEDYGSVGSAATTSESYGLVTASVDQVEDYHYIFYPAGETITPFGTIRVSGDSDKRQRFAYDGSGTIDIIGYALVPQRYEGSGSFSSFGGAAEVSGSNPPDQITPIVISGAATNLKNTFSNVGSGTIVISGDAGTEVRGKPQFTGSGTIEISGTVAESFVPATAIGSGSFSSFGGAAEVNGDNPPDQTVAIVISGAASNLKNTYGNVGSGTILISGDAGTEVRGKPQFTGSGTIEVSGTAGEAFVPQTYTASGAFSAFGGGAEVKGSNPPDQTVAIVISGGFSDPKRTYGNVGSGTIVISAGITTELQIYVPSFPGSGTATFSGTAGEAFVPQNYTGSGFFSAFGGGAEVDGSNPPDQTVPIVISGAASDLKNTYGNVGSGTAEFSGTKIEKRISSNAGSGTGVFSGTAGERFTPQTAVGSGTAEFSGTKIEKNTDSYNIDSVYNPGNNVDYDDLGILSDTVVYDDLGSVTTYLDPSLYEENGPTLFVLLYPYGTINISGGDNNPKRTFSNVGSGSFSAFGGGAEVNGDNPPDQTVPIVISGAASNLKNTYSNVGSGRFSAISGAAEVNGSNPPDQTLTIRLSGTAGERFTPQTAVGSGTITESGTKIEKRTKSYVGIGTFAITGTITPNVQIYVPSFPGSGTFSAISGAAEVKGSNPPDKFVLFTFSGTAREAFVPQTAVGSGTINISGVGIGISNPYRAPFVYVTII
jgi:hypothetical protein